MILRQALRIVFLALALILGRDSFAGVTCALPFNLTNGTTADASQVMANYTAITNCMLNNLAESGANSSITSLSSVTSIAGLTTPLSSAQGGTNVWYGGTSTGGANAQVVATLVPINFSLVNGYRAVFTAGFTNTGATTLNLNGTGATNIFKATAGGPVALTGGEIVANNAAMVAYDGTRYQLLNPAPVLVGPCSATGLKITNNAGTPDTKIDVTADTATMLSTTLPMYRTSVSVTVDTAITGANGMDVGTTPAAAWANVFLIDNGTAAAGLASLSATAPTLPAGYTFSCRLGAMRTTATKFLRTLQLGVSTSYVVTAATNTPNMPRPISGSSGDPTVPTWTAVGLGTFVPPTATTVTVVLNGASNNTAAIAAPNNNYGVFNSTTNPPPLVVGNAAGTTTYSTAMGTFVLESTNIYYASSQANDALFVYGWRDKVNAN